MYDQNFRNQAVKECVNGQSLSATARKYDISLSALRAWIKEYQERMAEMSKAPVAAGIDCEVVASARPMVELNSINITVDGYDITMSKRDVVSLMEIFYHFDKREGKRDDV